MPKVTHRRLATVVLLVAASMLAAILVGIPTAFAAGGPSAPSDGKPPGHSAPVPIPADVAAAVGRGPTDVLIGVDPGAGLNRIRLATRTRLDAASRRAGGDQAAASYAETKRGALARAGRGVHTKKDYDRLPVQLVTIDSPQALQALVTSGGVTSVSLPHSYQPVAAAPDLTLIHQPDAAQAGYTGSGTTVAVIDTGVDWTLPGVGSTFGDCTNGPGTAGCRIVNYSTTVTGPPTCVDEIENDPDITDHHGTNVSGVVAQTAPAADLEVFRVFKIVDCQRNTVSANDDDIMTALNAVVLDAPTRNVRSVNLSLADEHLGLFTSECAGSAYAGVFLNLRALGVVPVVAAGNNPLDAAGAFQPGVSSPACVPGALSVGAVYDDPNQLGSHSWAIGCTDEHPQVDSISCFSESGPTLGLLAPGLDVTGAGVTESGTSQASPHVAAAVADLVSANRSATAAQVVRALRNSGPSITDPRSNVTVRRLDINAAADAVKAPSAEVSDAGCTATSLPANDDGSTAAVNLPFVANFFGTSYSSLFVNNNGNVTFLGPQSTYTPFTISASTPPIIAPFFADVDTRGTGSGLVTYGTTTVGSRPAFCVNWDGVGYYATHTDKLNSFQLLLVDRSDVGAGDFDITMNYGAVNWETGDASGGAAGMGGTAAGAGYSAGDGNPAHLTQFPGSLTHLGLLDTNTATGPVNGSTGTLQPGRYIFPVRNGAPPGSATITGTVRDAGGVTQAAAPVQACPTGGGSCVVGLTGADGRYTIVGVTPGSFTLTANPPAGSALLPGRAGPLTVATGATLTQDLVLTGPQAPPPGTSITDHGTTAGGIPVLYWTDPLTLATSACAGGSVQYTLTQGTTTLRSGAMSESPPGSGHFTATVAPLRPAVGNATVTITSTCGDGTSATVVFTVYIDPSGTVVDTTGAPVQGATVTLFRADTSTGPLTAVPDGSAVMSPSARTNPERTGPDGVFHWDVIAGFYQVQASKPGCHAVDSTAPAAVSAVYEVPPPATDLRLVLSCAPTDTTAPVVTTTPITLEGNATGGYSGPRGGLTISDPDDPTVALTVTDDAPALLPLGPTTVTYTVRDPAGNAATATQVVTVVDTTPPSITCPSPVQGVFPGTPQLGRPSVTDVVDAAPAVVSDAPATFAAGATNVTWTATDHSGNHATCAQQVTLVAPTTLQYTGTLDTVTGASSTAAATLTSPAAACAAAQPVTFALDRNPTTGAVGSYALPGATTTGAGVATSSAVSTAGWQEGVYQITATYAGIPDRCQASSDTGALTVSGPASNAAGAGAYPVPGSGSALFGFVVSKRPNGSLGGQLALVNPGRWRFVGTVASYTKSGTTGTLTGTGTLSRWDTTLNRGHGGWAVTASAVPFTARAVDNPGTTGPARNGGDRFGITIAYTPSAGLPPLPNTAPALLTTGRIVLR